MTHTAEDGRVARGQRTRERVVEALYELFTEGNLTPTWQELAARAGRTTRAIYHHFPDLDAVVVALGEEQMRRHRTLFAAHPIEGTRDQRVDGIVAHRVELFEVVAPTRRAALTVIHSSPALRTQQASLADRLRQQLSRTFAPELSGLDSSTATNVLDLLDLHTSWDTWERLRTGQRLSVERSLRLVTGLVINAIGDRTPMRERPNHHE